MEWQTKNVKVVSMHVDLNATLSPLCAGRFTYAHWHLWRKNLY